MVKNIVIQVKNIVIFFIVCYNVNKLIRFFRSNMDKISKEVHILFFWAIFASIGFFVGIPMIVFGAVYALWVILALGVILVIFGFYGTPVLWVNYSSKRKLKNIVSSVVNEHIYTVTLLASRYSVSRNKMKTDLSECFKKGYLAGYLFDGENITANFTKAYSEQVITVKCPNCGANCSFKASSDFICPYCGTNLTAAGGGNPDVK